MLSWSYGISLLCSDVWSVIWISVTHSRAAVRSCRRSRHQPGAVQANERGQSLRHPVSDHGHGAEHNSDLKQGQWHLCAPFFHVKSFIIRAPSRHWSASQCCPAKFGCAFEPRLGTESLGTWWLIFSLSFTVNPALLRGCSLFGCADGCPLRSPSLFE